MTGEPPYADDLTIVDSATQLDSCHGSTVAVVGSHGGRYPALLAARSRVRAIVFNDAGVGRDRAGISGLDQLEELDVPAAAVSHVTARIGDGANTLRHGRISHVNAPARALGCTAGMPCQEAVRLLAGAATPRVQPPQAEEARYLLRDGRPRVWALDSASLADDADADDVLVTGSHGGLLGGKPETALRTAAIAAVFNDAGIGRDGAGLSRLPALDERGIAAVTVSAHSARVGDGRSTYDDGVLSAQNEAATHLGARTGMPTPEFVDLVLASLKDQHTGTGVPDDHDS
ncbi:hypothetical protein G4Z16_01625 [Streptomyces bathyalis]|uniref:Uncharacterized protein n=1 Tax=Streptomyces bathyalis TaxID=2710756 RepID=A0A7T1WPT5_9ACTN|nr:hypothetical protein [Streptomyces bathyalis]QPP05303.1 hypothetical protein G4Z16_01625 [Streptomyces bathyalis]